MAGVVGLLIIQKQLWIDSTELYLTHIKSENQSLSMVDVCTYMETALQKLFYL